MAVRFFITPKVELVAGTFSPKYFRVLSDGQLTDGIAGWWTAINFGPEPFLLVKADVTNAEQTSISGNADVLTVPANIENNVGGGQGLTAARNGLESRNIPGSWVTSGMTWRTVLRFAAHYALLQQVFGRRAVARFFQLYTLNTTMAQMTAAHRDRLREAAEELGVTDTSSITGSSTVRDVLRLLIGQMQRPIRMGVGAGEVL